MGLSTGEVEVMRRLRGTCSILYSDTCRSLPVFTATANDEAASLYIAPLNY